MNTSPLTKTDSTPSKNSRLFTTVLVICGLMVVASVALGAAGASYIQAYESAHSGCPPSNPYSAMIFAAGGICLAGFILDVVLAFKRKRIKFAILLIVGALLSAVVLFFSLFASAFCITF